MVVEPEDGLLWMRLRWTEGVKDFIRAEFGVSLQTPPADSFSGFFIGIAGGQSPNRYFSRLPSISKSRFSPPTSNVPFPLSASPLTMNLYSTWNLLSPTTRSAENVSSPSFSFRSWRFVSFWSGQLIVPVSLSPSFLIVSVDVRFWSPILYSHFHVPTGSDWFAATARPQTTSTNATDRIALSAALSFLLLKNTPPIPVTFAIIASIHASCRCR